MTSLVRVKTSLYVTFIFTSNHIIEITMSNNRPILVTGAAGNVGSVGRGVVKLLRERDLPVRALVHRLDERSQVLSEMGAERSEERRVGKECRSRWSPYNYKNKMSAAQRAVQPP